MLSKILKFSFKNTQFNLSSVFSHKFSTQKSQQQLSYFTSRKTTYDKHQYPHYKPTLTLTQFANKYTNLKNNTETSTKEQAKQKVVGRVSAIRKHGKTTFLDIRQEHIKLQVAIKSDKELEIKRGDVIGIQGVPFVTHKGELSIHCLNVNDVILLAPCLWMLPEYQALKDPQARFRNKPLDLLTNSHSVQIVKKRAKIISSLRKILEQNNYIQVETPMLSPSCGGAIAKPFVTFHNDHKANLFLRIAPELYLKKLLVGGISRVFEIGKNFRNQSIDQTHNPEFTSCQLYCAYQDYRGMMQFTHTLLNRIAKQVNGTSIIKGINSKGQTVDIDLSQKWNQVDFMTGLEKALGIKLPTDFQNKQTLQFYDRLLEKNNIPCENPRTIDRLLDKLAGRYLETTHQPFFIINHPQVMSPLAKPLKDQRHLTQRFQLFINNFQVVNSYTQLNDPRIQKQNTPTDTDFVQALEYGLMPCAGWGIGLDRFIMLLTGNTRIQQVLAFPLLKQILQNKQTQKSDE